MTGVVYKNSTKDITVEQAVDAYRVGIILEVNDGKHITMSVDEKEPTSREAE